MPNLLLALLLVLLAGCMKVSDMAAGTEYQLRDAGVLDHSDIRRAYNWRLQPDSFIYIAQGAFALQGDGVVRPNVVADEAFKGFVEYFPLVRRASGPLGLEKAMAETRMAGAIAMTPSKCLGNRCVNIIPCRPPPEQPMK